jgi:hypothetical protein
MTLVGSVAVGSGGAASIEFTNIPQNGNDLLCFFSTREASSFDGVFRISINNNLESSGRGLAGDGSTVSGPLDGHPVSVRSDFTASTFGNAFAYFPNYSGSQIKIASNDSVAENNAASGLQRISTSEYSSTAAITSVKLGLPSGGNFAENSTAYLYKITKV